MNWISDVKLELKELDTSVKSLRKFAFLVGAIFLLIAFLIWLRGHAQFAYYLFGSIGILLIITGLLFPHVLKNIYRLWMGMAFAIGWLVSRILLMAIFYFVIAPIGLAALILGKEFLDIKMGDGRESYWIKRNIDRKTNYEKMY